MDLLDELEDHGRQHQTYLDTQVIGTHDEISDEETAADAQAGSMLGMNFNMGGISKSLTGDMGNMPDMSVLDKVRQRLYGDGGSETQSSETQSSETQRIDEDRENEDGSTQVGGDSTHKAHILPQLSIDDAEIVSQPREGVSFDYTTQKVDTGSGGGLFVHDNDETERPQTMTREDRQLKIAQLAERKRQERLAKEKQQEELEADITHTTLTDEENDINGHNDSVVPANVSAKQMKEADEFLNIKKREKKIQPEFKRRVIFTKDRLLSAFADDGSEQSDYGDNSQDTAIKSSPVTSPLKIVQKTDPFANNNHDEDENILNLLDAMHSPKQLVKQPQKNPIEIYAQNLKLQLLSSPTRSTNNKLINLDSDSESVSNSESEFETRNAINDELKKIPLLSKEDRLSIKQKFSKKKMSAQTPVFASLPRLLRKVISLEKNPNSVSFLGHLRKANINQLLINKQLDPDNEILEELEKDEEVMGSLLEREMENVKNIRRKEKLREKAALALSGKGAVDGSDAELENYNNEQDIDGDVPDSDVDSNHSSNYDSIYEGEAQNEEDEDEYEDNTLSKANRKAKRLVVSDDEDGDTGKHTAEESQRKRNDDSYMFGVIDHRDNEDSLGIENDDFITTVNTQKLRAVFGSGASLTQAFESGTQVLDKTNNESIFDNLRKDDSITDGSNMHGHGTDELNNKKYELFKNLKPREKTFNIESQVPEDINKSSILHTELPSFQDIIETGIQNTQPDSISTQVDNPSQFEASTQIDDTTQTIHDNSGIPCKIEVIDNEDENDINPSAIKSGRKLIRKNLPLNSIMEDEEQSEEEPSPEEMQHQIKLYEEKIRRNELKSRKKQKELERMGMKNIVEGEAEESEDEWHGLGGVDGDLSDDQADSEDEKMIDNNFNIDLKNDDLRRKFMEEYQIKDQKELEKLLDDVKNHRLTKRANGNGFDIELSDEEDELLSAYRKQKLKEQQARLMNNKKLHELAKNEKSKAFFESIQDSTLSVNIDDEDDFDQKSNEKFPSQTQVKNPLVGADKENKSDNESDVEGNDEEPKKKTIIVEESFVQKQLSFLMKSGKEDYEHEQNISNKQHGFDSSDDEIDDLQTLKSKSLSNLHSGKRSKSPTTIDEILNKRAHENSDTDIDEEFMPTIKKPSIINSFRLSSSQQGIQVKDGKQFSGVTISKQYKTASGSKASITYLSKAKGNPVKSLKERQIEKSLNNAKNNNRKLFNSGGFEN